MRILATGFPERLFRGLDLALVEVGHGFETDEFDQVGGGQRTRGLSRADFSRYFERFIRNLTGQKRLGQPQAGVQVLGIELQNAGELQR